MDDDERGDTVTEEQGAGGAAEAEQAAAADEGRIEVEVLEAAQLPTNMRRPDEMAPAITEQSPEEVRAEIGRLKKDVEVTYFRMGELLYRVQDGKLFLDWGYKTFGEYTSAELGFEERKGYYLARTWKTLCVKLGVQRDRMEGLGVSHAREIAKVATPETVGAWIERARALPVAKLVEEINTEQKRVEIEAHRASGRTEDEIKEAVKEKPKSLAFKLFPEQRDIVQRALKRAEYFAQSDKPGNLVTLICTEYLATNLEGDDDAQVEWYVRLFEQRFKGRKLLAFANEDAARAVLAEVERRERLKDKAREGAGS